MTDNKQIVQHGLIRLVVKAGYTPSSKRARDKALTALDNLIDPAELIGELRGMKVVSPVMDEDLAYKDAIYERGIHNRYERASSRNAAIDAIINKLEK